MKLHNLRLVFRMPIGRFTIEIDGEPQLATGDLHLLEIRATHAQPGGQRHSQIVLSLGQGIGQIGCDKAGARIQVRLGKGLTFEHDATIHLVIHQGKMLEMLLGYRSVTIELQLWLIIDQYTHHIAHCPSSPNETVSAA